MLRGVKIPACAGCLPFIRSRTSGNSLALLGMKKSPSCLAIAINRGGVKRSPRLGASRHKQPVRHRFDRGRSRIPRPSCLINLGGREITPGAIDETQIESLAIERRSARGSARGFLQTQRWQALLQVAYLAVANLTPHTLRGSRLRIILHTQAYSALRCIVEDLKEHSNLCGGILVSRHVSIPSRAAMTLRHSPCHDCSTS